MKSNGHRQGTVLIATLTLAAVALSSTGCGILKPTRGRRGDATHSGFLGDYSQLKPQEGYAAQEVYIDRDATWSNYNAIYIESVSMWVNEESKALSREDQQMLTDMLYKAMRDKLGEKFKLADHPGPA